MSRPRRLSWSKLPDEFLWSSYDPDNNASLIETGVFSFLGETRMLGRPLNWNPDAPVLWKFNLHYFNYLHLLDPNGRDRIRKEWMSANPASVRSVAWHPYPTSLRIVNWCRSGSSDADINASLARQADYLYRNCETHLLGNHLLENARALLVAGAYFKGTPSANKWTNRGLLILLKQIDEQVLADGAHFERSPMYHAIVLVGLLDAVATHREDLARYPVLSDTIRKMLQFLAGVTRPDGTLAQFNDCSNSVALPTRRITEYAQSMGFTTNEVRSEFPEGGYYRTGSGDGFQVIVDAGDIGPDYLPAHAHADIFSYECYLRETPLVVDTGVYEYAEGNARRFDRSTRAHSTVTVDGIDQAEMWSSFRVGRRFRPKNVRVSRSGKGWSFHGVFDGYGRLVGDDIRHVREIMNTGREVSVSDVVSGFGSHLVSSRITLHPDVQVVAHETRAELTACGESIRFEVQEGVLRLENGMYSSRFGERRNRTVLVVEHDGPLPCALRYTLSVK